MVWIGYIVPSDDVLDNMVVFSVLYTISLRHFYTGFSIFIYLFVAFLLCFWNFGSPLPPKKKRKKPRQFIKHETKLIYKWPPGNINLRRFSRTLMGICNVIISWSSSFLSYNERQKAISRSKEKFISFENLCKQKKGLLR